MTFTGFSRRRFLLVLAFALCLPFTAAWGQAPHPPATILIIRHAEKLTDGRLDLSETGFKRAALLPKLFLPAGVRPDLPTPQFLFATHQSKHSNRPVETITPLSEALHLPISHDIMDEDYAELRSEFDRVLALGVFDELARGAQVASVGRGEETNYGSPRAGSAEGVRLPVGLRIKWQKNEE